MKEQMEPKCKISCCPLEEVISSIALAEAATAHILNAEGEKIQAVVAMPGVTPDQLLAVNASVQATINAITNLEMILQNKLHLFSDSINAYQFIKSKETDK